MITVPGIPGFPAPLLVKAFSPFWGEDYFWDAMAFYFTHPLVFHALNFCAPFLFYVFYTWGWIP